MLGQRRRERIHELEKRSRQRSRAASSVASPRAASSVIIEAAATSGWNDLVPPSTWHMHSVESNLLPTQGVSTWSVQQATEVPLVNSDAFVCSSSSSTGTGQLSRSSPSRETLNPQELLVATTNNTSPSQSHDNNILPLQDELQALELSQFTFPDDGLLPVPELAVMRASTNIAILLNSATAMWDLTNLRTFSLASLPDPNIPPNLVPTSAQQTIPHHPLFDLFPWPAVRTRIICVFAQPVHTRPESARDPDALMKLFMDLDDGREGVRVGGNGSDWYDGRNWEVGETVYRNWWWALDREVIDNSNRLRRLRGAPKLTMGPL